MAVVPSESEKVPFIPQELVKEILSHIPRGSKSLQACSLVSRSWVDPSYFFLFDMVTITWSYPVNKFIDHLRLSPVFPSYISCLRLMGNCYDSDLPLDVLPPYTLGVLLSYLPRLAFLTLNTIPLTPSFYYDLSTGGGPKFSIQKVAIAGCGLTHSSSLVRTLQNFAEIGEFSFLCPIFEAPSFTFTEDDVACNAHNHQTRVYRLKLDEHLWDAPHSHDLFLTPKPTVETDGRENVLVITYPRSLKMAIRPIARGDRPIPDRMPASLSETLPRTEGLDIDLSLGCLVINWESNSVRGALSWFQRLGSLKHLTLRIALFGGRREDVEEALEKFHQIVQNLLRCSRTLLQSIKLIVYPFETLQSNPMAGYTQAQPEGPSHIMFATALLDRLSRSIEDFQLLEKLEFEWRIPNLSNAELSRVAKTTNYVKEGMARLNRCGLLHFSTNTPFYEF
ncbi:hypothetical protein NLI96_g1269 [Meripilus lineatus]|uniref:F-box domain-containing protein n=1 Tax=Meripilus lineatus TaxID=2056292 RepID=A0AAD5VD63_9APHY|nr:hypothetical protein NLI96_g1269 [Physisporinus lineatus]